MKPEFIPPPDPETATIGNTFSAWTRITEEAVRPVGDEAVTSGILKEVEYALSDISPYGVISHSTLLERLRFAHSDKRQFEQSKRALVQAWSNDPRVTVVRFTPTATLYEVAHTEEDKVMLDRAMIIHRQIVAEQGGPAVLYRQPLKKILLVVMDQAVQELPDMGLSWDETNKSLMRTRTVEEYRMTRDWQVKLNRASSVSSRPRKKRDPATEVPAGFNIPFEFRDASYEDLRQVAWRLNTRGGSTGSVHETVGEAVDSFVAALPVVALRWRRSIFRKIAESQAVHKTTQQALTTIIFRDQRFTVLGKDSFNNTLHRITPPRTKDVENIRGHEQLASQLVAFLRQKRVEGEFAPQLAAQAALESMGVTGNWNLRYLGYLMCADRHVETSYESGSDGVTMHLKLPRLRKRKE